MPRPAIKKTRKLAKAKREGELKADAEHEFKSIKWLADLIPFLPEKYKKNAVLWMKKIFERHLSKIPKGVAIIGMTLIVKHVIHESDELLAKVKRMAFPDWFKAEKGRQYFWFMGLYIPFELPFGEKPKEPFAEGILTDLHEWLISFAIAYIIVEHGGQIALGLGEAVKGLGGIVAFLLG